MPYIVEDGVRLYYEEMGSGTPILFIHPPEWVISFSVINNLYQATSASSCMICAAMGKAVRRIVRLRFRC